MTARRLVIAGTILNAMVLTALVTQFNRAVVASDAGTLRATAIELVDEHGRVRAQLNVESNGEAVFRLRDSKGQVRVKLGADGEGSGLLLLDGATEPGIQMLAQSGGTSVTLTKGGQRRVITP